VGCSGDVQGEACRYIKRPHLADAGRWWAAFGPRLRRLRALFPARVWLAGERKVRGRAGRDPTCRRDAAARFDRFGYAAAPERACELYTVLAPPMCKCDRHSCHGRTPVPLCVCWIHLDACRVRPSLPVLPSHAAGRKGQGRGEKQKRPSRPPCRVVPALFSWWPKRQCGLRPTMTPAGGGEPATARRRAATEERKTGGKASSAHYRQTATSHIRVLYIRTKVQCTRTASARVRGPRQRRLSIGARVLGATCPSQNSQSTAAPAMMVLG
jgi:hypothetical protein